MNSGLSQWDHKRLVKDQLTQIKLLSNDLLIREEEISILQDKTAEYEELIMEYEEKIGMMTEELTKMERDSNQREDEAFERIQSLTFESQEMSTQLNVRKTENEHLKREIEIYRESLKSSETKNLYLEGEIQSLKEQCSLREEAIRKQRTKFRNLKDKARGVKDENRELKGKLEEITLDLERIKVQNDTVISEQERKQSAVQELVEEYKELEDRAYQLDSENTNIRKQFDELKARNENLQTELATLAETKNLEENLMKLNKDNLDRLENQISVLIKEKASNEHKIETMTSTLQSINSENTNVSADLKSLLRGMTSSTPSNYTSSFASEFTEIHSKWTSLNKKRNALKSEYKRLHEEKEAIVEAIQEINQKQIDLHSNAEALKFNEKTKLESLQRELSFSDSQWKANERNLLDTIIAKEHEIDRLTRMTDEYMLALRKRDGERENAGQRDFEFDSFLVNLSILACVVSSLYKSQLELTNHKDQLQRLLNPILYIYYELQPFVSGRRFRGVVWAVLAIERLKRCSGASKKNRNENDWISMFSREIQNSPLGRVIRWAKVEPIQLEELEKVVSLGFSSESPVYTANHILSNFVVNLKVTQPLYLQAESVIQFYSHLLEEHQIYYQSKDSRLQSNGNQNLNDRRLLSVKNDVQADMIRLQRENKELMSMLSTKAGSRTQKRVETNEHLFTLDNEENEFEKDDDYDVNLRKRQFT